MVGGADMSDRLVLRKDLFVLDRETRLMWQRQASEDRMVWKDGFDYVERLNQSQWGGYDDWRFPDKDELATLLTPEENRETGLYISPLFGPQRCLWSSTEADHHRAVYADYYYGDLYLVEENYATHFVRAVRTLS
ncbi:DUF1566 domain-containing protein [Desulfoglaeba alkanexedens ALDC]|jgi:serine/threonine-protein kinase|uniref:DUF1566 domain-containing protein n=2 Tax=Desulfoglaeba alkanexedens TaxID=361111 RepID=A0A4P8L4S4_9BACT|nr:DUF1566 domain-containing protein [Desulfoglaeba alkanexedens ALDC]